MSVTFNRAQLIRVAKAALSEHDKASADHLAARDQYKARHAKENSNLPALRKFRDWLTSELKKGTPVTAPGYEVTNGGNVAGLFYSAPSEWQIDKVVTAPKGLLKPSEVIETRALLKVLEAATGDTVSVNELKLLGLKNLQPVFTAAGNEASK